MAATRAEHSRVARNQWSARGDRKAKPGRREKFRTTSDEARTKVMTNDMRPRHFREGDTDEALGGRPSPMRGADMTISAKEMCD